MVRLIKHGDVLQLYTEYADVDKCRSILGGTWNKRNKCWEYPLGAVKDIREVFNYKVEMDAPTSNWYKDYYAKVSYVQKLKRGGIEPREHPFLMRHQRICRDIASVMDRYAFFLDTGTGKTITALSIIEENDDVKWLVICPKSIIKTAWLADQQAFFPDIRMLPISRNMKKEDYENIAHAWDVTLNNRLSLKQLQETMLPYAQVYVTNPESFKADISKIQKLGVKGLILDESSMIKNPSAQITKEVTRFVDNMEYVYLLSGKPAPNNELEYFPQIRLIDESIFGRYISKFKTHFFDACGYMGYDLQLKLGAEKEIAERLDRCSLFIRKEDCLDLPDKTYIVREVELPEKAWKQYKEMERHQFLDIEKAGGIDVNTKLAMLMKLRQITSGFIINTDTKEVAQLHSAKLDELANVITELGGNKAIIWINFKEEVHFVSRVLTTMKRTFVTAYSETADVDKSISDFKEDKAQFIIAHPKTLKYGVTFTGGSMKRNCTYAIYYSLSYSFEDYYQSHDRIYRHGQTEPCTFIFLLVDKSIDMDIYNILQQKGDKADIIEQFIRRNKD